MSPVLDSDQANDGRCTSARVYQPALKANWTTSERKSVGGSHSQHPSPIWTFPQMVRRWMRDHHRGVSGSNLSASTRNDGDFVALAQISVIYGGLFFACEGFLIWKSPFSCSQAEGRAQTLLVIISFPHQTHFTVTSPNFNFGQPPSHQRLQPQKHVEVTDAFCPCPGQHVRLSPLVKKSQTTTLPNR